MKGKLKLIGGIIAAVAAVVCIIAAVVFFSSPSSLLSALPKPDDTRPYAVAEIREGCFPNALSSMLTNGVYAQFRSGTARGCLLLLASIAEESALLAAQEADGSLELYTAMKFSASDMKQLRKGALPESWKTALQSPEILDGAKKGTWLLRMKGVEAPIYFKAESKRIVLAADSEAFGRLLSVLAGDEKSAGKISWSDEKKWPGHLEIGDGGLLFADHDQDSIAKETPEPLKLQIAWDKAEVKSGTESGQARWTIIGLDKRVDSSVLRSLAACKWDTSNCLIPSPLLLSAGLNMPGLRGSPSDWPFPLSSIGEIGRKIGLSDGDIRDLLSGQTIYSLGGQNKILWFTLPGFMVELTGGRKRLEPLVDSFWKKMFYDADVKPLSGFDYGGTASVPFSVLAAGRGDMAVLGLIAPESLSGRDRLGKLLGENEKAIGWVLADLPRIGAALNDMTKMNSFMENESDEDTGSPADTAVENSPADQTGSQTEPFQPSGAVSPFDQNISDSLGSVLKDMGKILLVWEKPESGRISWYKQAAHETEPVKK